MNQLPMASKLIKYAYVVKPPLKPKRTRLSELPGW